MEELKQYYLLEEQQRDINNEIDTYDNLRSALIDLERELHTDINYMYKCNKDNVYNLYKVEYKESIQDYEYDLIKSIKVSEFVNMSYEDKMLFLESEM